MKEPATQPYLPACIRSCILATLLCSIAFNCSDSTGPDSDSSGNQYASIEIGADGGTVDVTAEDGTICRLTIPAGTLSETTNIKITAESSSSETQLTTLANNFLLEPEGLAFDEPVTISITVTDAWPEDRAPAILHTVTDGQSTLLDTQVNGLTLSATLDHFSNATPVAPTAQQLELYWDSTLLEIDTYGVSVEPVLTLASIYLHAEANSDVYSSIDLTSANGWKAELWAQTNDLIIKGILRCESGGCDEGEYILNAAINISSICLFTDLLAEAQQAQNTCCQSGMIVINQTPDELTDAGWSLTGPRNETGSGDVTLTGMPVGDYTLVWKEVDGYITPPNTITSKTLTENDTITFGGRYIQKSELPAIHMRISEVTRYAIIRINGVNFVSESAFWGGGDSGWKGPYYSTPHNGLNIGENTFSFIVYADGGFTASAYFEVKVDGELIISKHVESTWYTTYEDPYEEAETVMIE